MLWKGSKLIRNILLLSFLGTGWAFPSLSLYILASLESCTPRWLTFRPLFVRVLAICCSLESSRPSISLLSISDCVLCIMSVRESLTGIRNANWIDTEFPQPHSIDCICLSPQTPPEPHGNRYSDYSHLVIEMEIDNKLLSFPANHQSLHLTSPYCALRRNNINHGQVPLCPSCLLTRYCSFRSSERKGGIYAFLFIYRAITIYHGTMPIMGFQLQRCRTFFK